MKTDKKLIISACDYALLKIDISIRCLIDYVPCDEWERDRIETVLTELQKEKEMLDALLCDLDRCDKDTYVVGEQIDRLLMKYVPPSRWS